MGDEFMKSRQFILKETALLALGEAVCVLLMCGIFAMLGTFSYKVIVGALLGVLLAVGNFFFMAISADAAADRAMQDDVKGGKQAVKASYSFRLIVIGVLLFLFAKSGQANLIAMVVPLFLVFPILTVVEFFRKSGGNKA